MRHFTRALYVIRDTRSQSESLLRHDHRLLAAMKFLNPSYFVLLLHLLLLAAMKFLNPSYFVLLLHLLLLFAYKGII